MGGQELPSQNSSLLFKMGELEYMQALSDVSGPDQTQKTRKWVKQN